MKKSDIITAPIVTYARHRIQSDGDGVTTLVCFHGCPLRCKMCINPFSYESDTKYTQMTPSVLYEKLKIDNLYFLATGGGVTFGGGEPLLYPGFIAKFRNICPKEWRIGIETSLNVPWENVEKVIDSTDFFVIDTKDTDPDIYKAYTGKDNTQMLDNLKKLVGLFPIDSITARVPLITNYNTKEDNERSIELLKNIGIKNIDSFEYVDPKNRSNLFK